MSASKQGGSGGGTPKEADPGGGAAAAAGAAAGGAAEPLEARSADLRLAHVHLRTGAFALARAELETLAGRQALDRDGMLDLAEVRWRTGDLPGAGEAVSSYLAVGGEAALGFVIAAEVAAAADRPAEARRLVGRALDRSEASLDAIFAGIPRSLIWPHDTWEEPPAPLPAGSGSARPGGVPAIPGGNPALPGGIRSPGARRAGGETTGGVRGGAAVGAGDESARQPNAAMPGDAGQSGLWDTPGAPGQLEAHPEVVAGALALRRGDAVRAAIHLGVALRLAPSVAAAVLETIGAHREGVLELVRGDALRLLGYEWDARRAYMSVAAGLRAQRDEALAPEKPADPDENRAAAPAAEASGGKPSQVSEEDS